MNDARRFVNHKDTEAAEKCDNLANLELPSLDVPKKGNPDSRERPGRGGGISIGRPG